MHVYKQNAAPAEYSVNPNPLVEANQRVIGCVCEVELNALF